MLVLILENQNEIGHVENLVVNGRVILKWISEKKNIRMWTGLIYLRITISEVILEIR
jgi:hypothetical protein